MPTTINGTLHPSNKNCIDWSERGLIAFASHSVITIVDPWTLQRIQVLELHNSAICELHWCPSRRFLDEGESSLLASADISGEIVVSDVITAQAHARLRIAGAQVNSLCWFAWKDTSRDFILALHSKGQLVLWNTDTNNKVWSHTYSTPYTRFLTDPFDAGRLCLLSSSNSLTIVSDISLNAAPVSPGITVILPKDSPIQTAAFHRAYRNQLFVVADNTLYCINADVGVILSRRSLDSSPLTLLASLTRDALYVVHANGSISLRVGRVSKEGECSSSVVASIEGGREGGGQRRPLAAVLCPSTDAAVAVLHANGKMSIWQLENKSISGLPYRSYSIDDIVGFSDSLETTVEPPTRLRMTSQLSSISSGATLMRVRPLSTEMEDPWSGMQLAAIGTQHGKILVCDLFTARILKEIHAQNSPIKSLEWAGPHSLLSAGYNHALSSTNLVRNDLFITDIRTGTSRRIRPEKDESPLTLMRLSHYNCYMALSFQSDPLEIWDLKSLRLLRKMSKTCPIIVDMSWSSKHHGVRQTETISVYRENLVVLDSENRLYHVVVKGLHVRDGKEVNTQWRGGGWQLRCMSWKEDLLALGDADGRVVLWNLGRRRSTEARNSKSPCLRMAFSRVAQDFTLIVLHPREVLVWDAEKMSLQHSVSLEAHKSVIDVELCGLTLFAICSDNCVRVASTTDVNRPLLDQEVPLLGDSSRGGQELGRPGSPSSQWDSNKLPRPDTIRSMLAALSVLSDRMKDASVVRKEMALSRFLGRMSSFSLLSILDLTLYKGPLLPHLQLLWPADKYRERESVLSSALCRLSPSQYCIEEAVVLGGESREAAVDSLVASPDNLLVSSLKGALLVSQQDGEHAKSLIKLIATNLIASDHMSDGVQLLFLVGAGADACKYLQSQRMWYKSVRYAKLGLQEEALEDVLAKWLNHLQMDEKSLTVLVHASRGNWNNVAILLESFRQTRLANLISSHSSTM
ncbi:hypothetical protein PFISCL1PPCAC_19425 [Pristionchus fissidentatus]|uniref:WD40 domain-containing protein n=1 Tax=Pristionchus fissidentatus TaxID=1538716 RepID=A0AAV5W9D9_9BILA|nr:hypothetical protein PFISCL1PPCAC_19425 [Pristionchus fissidentatus]